MDVVKNMEILLIFYIYSYGVKHEYLNRFALKMESTSFKNL